MYIVLEMQTTNGTTAIVPPETFSNEGLAYQRFYSILAAAAVSPVPIHSAVILNERGEIVRTECFIRQVEEEQINE